MCGVFGFVSTSGHGPDLDRLEHIAKVTERRGPHAFGMAWVDGRGRLKCYKQTGKISENLSILRQLAADARLLIGHCRFATHGSPENNLNNHPHPVDGGWFVHNGVIRNHEQIAFAHSLNLVTQCDSEVLGGLVESLDGSLLARCAAAGQIAGERGVLAMLAVWRNPSRLVVVRAGNPLSAGVGGRGIYLASLREGLPTRNTDELKDNTATSFGYRNGVLETKSLALESVDAGLLF